MPRFQISDSATGRTLIVEGDSPPTEQEAAELFASAGPAPSADQPEAKPKDDRSLWQKFRGTLEERAARRARGDIPSDMGIAALPRAEQGEAYRVNAALAARVGAPIAAGIMTGGAGLLPAMAATAGAGGAGELAAQRIEGSPMSVADAAKAAILSAVPAGPVIGAGRGMLNTGVQMGAMGGLAAVAGEATRRQMTGEQQFQSVGEAAREAMVPAGLVGGLGAVGAGLKKLATARAARTERLATLAEAGIEQPTLDLIFPSQAALVNRVAARTPELQKLRIDSTRPLMEGFEQMVAGAPQGEEVFAALRPYVGKVDQARAAVAQAEQAAAQLEAKAATAVTSADVPPAVRQQAVAEASAAQLNALNTRARMLYEARVNLGDFVDHHEMAQQFAGTVGKLFQTRKALGAAKFAEAGLADNAALFPKEELRAAAQAGLQRWRGTDLETRILGAIDSAGGEEAAALTLGQFRELRQSFTDRFAGLDPRQLAAAEAAGKAAYGAVTDATRKVIGRTPGANLGAYDSAVAYWRETAEAAASRYARPLLAEEPAATTFQTLANDLAAGRPSDVAGFNEFVRAVAPDAPEIARLASQQLTTAVRNSFLGEAMTATGVDTGKLVDRLQLAARKSKFDVTALGFGSPAEIKRWGETFKEFNLKNLPAADFHAIFASPEVQRAALSGLSVAEALRPAAARAAFERNVYEQAARSLAGDKVGAAEAAAEANRLAAAARLTVGERRAVLSQLEADPVMQAFSRGQDYGIPAREGAGGIVNGVNAVTSTIFNLGPEKGTRLIRALEKTQPEVADLVRRRVVGDALQVFRPANTDGHVWALNKAKVRQFFKPAPGSEEFRQAATLKAIVGDKPFAEMQRLLHAVELVHDVERSGGILSTDGAKTIYAATSIGRSTGLIPGQMAPSAYAAGLTKLRDLWDGAKYPVLSLLATNNKFANRFWTSGGDIAQGLVAIGPERGALVGRDAYLRAAVERQLTEPNEDRNRP